MSETKEEVVEVEIPISETQRQVVSDLSQSALSIGRITDRLPLNGCYILRIVKPDTKGQRWQVEVVKVEKMQSGEY